MKKILFILGMYHPNYSANGLCCKNVIDKCVDKGWQVDCIVNAARGNEKEYILDGAEVYTVKPRLFSRISERCDSHSDSKLYGTIKKAAIALNKLKLFLMSPFWPLVSPIYTYRFYKKAKELHKDKGFDIVVTAYTPIDSLLSGCFLKKKYPEIKFVPYYLDALAGGWGPSRWSEQKKEKHTRRWETKIDQRADLVISMESSREYHKNHPLESIRPIKRTYLDVPMMLPEIKTERCDKPRKILLFAGTVAYPQRNPIPLLEVFSRACKEEDIELLFVGQCNNPSIFKPYFRSSNGKISYLGAKSHEEVLELEKKADFLINIGNDNPYLIPSKIFEYMRFSKPIISTFAIENEPSIAYLKKYGNAFFLDERQPFDESADRLLEFIKNGSLSELPQGYCQKAFWTNTPEAFAETLENNF